LEPQQNNHQSHAHSVNHQNLWQRNRFLLRLFAGIGIGAV